MSDKEIYRWKLPEDHPNYTGHDDLPKAYKVEENDKATCGIVISGKYHGEWVTNPWNTRTLVKHLLDENAELRQQDHDFRNGQQHVMTGLDNRAEYAERGVAKLAAYIEQEKFNWRLDRERANGAEAEIIKLKTELEDRCLVIAKLKAERDNLQMTLRSLKMRGE